jgi:hypothetical protein
VVAFDPPNKVSVRNTLTKYCLLCHKKRPVSSRIALHQKFFIPAWNAQTCARSTWLAFCRCPHASLPHNCQPASLPH